MIFVVVLLMLSGAGVSSVTTSLSLSHCLPNSLHLCTEDVQRWDCYDDPVLCGAVDDGRPLDHRICCLQVRELPEDKKERIV